jgi:hypothetical protein
MMMFKILGPRGEILYSNRADEAMTIASRLLYCNNPQLLVEALERGDAAVSWSYGFQYITIEKANECTT